MIRKQTLAYLAGFFDGEGTICICRRHGGSRRSFELRICVGQKDRKPLELFLKTFGGAIFLQRRHGIPLLYQWDIGGSSKPRRFLEMMLPYLRCKKEEAKIALRYLDAAEKLACGKHYVNGSIENYKERVLCFLKCKAIKRQKYNIERSVAVPVQSEIQYN